MTVENFAHQQSVTRSQCELKKNNPECTTFIWNYRDYRSDTIYPAKMRIMFDHGGEIVLWKTGGFPPAAGLTDVSHRPGFSEKV